MQHVGIRRIVSKVKGWPIQTLKLIERDRQPGFKFGWLRRERRIIKVDFLLSRWKAGSQTFVWKGSDIIGNCLRNSLITTPPSINTNYFQLFTLIRLTEVSLQLFLHIGESRAMGKFHLTVNKAKRWKSWEDNEVSKFVVWILLYDRADERSFENNAMLIMPEKSFINYQRAK